MTCLCVLDKYQVKNVWFLGLHCFVGLCSPLEHWMTVIFKINSTGSWRFVLFFKFSSSHFSEIDDLSNKHWAKVVQTLKSKYFNFMFWMQSYALVKGLLSRIMVYPVWALYLTWAIWKWKSNMQKIGSRLVDMMIQIPLFLQYQYKTMA